MGMVNPAQHASHLLDTMWRRERWHQTHATGWLGDAIYGVNDGLGAIFGIIAGVAGYTANTHTVLISGLFGALASTLSMGAGAWLATKSESELQHQEIEHAQDDELFVKTMAQEELGIQEISSGGHWKSAFVGSVSTLVGGVVPLIPLFFLTGSAALIGAAIVSILAHFAVGAAKSVLTVRSWWASGVEMTFAGIIVGVVAYGLGFLGTLLIHV